MPPPMTTARACGGSSAMVPIEFLPADLKTPVVILAVAAVIKCDPRAQCGPRPHQRLTQQGGTLYRCECAPRRRRDRPAKIALQQRCLEYSAQLVVRGQVGEVEQRRVKSGVFPVDQPQALTVVDQIGGEQIVVTEHDVHGS